MIQGSAGTPCLKPCGSFDMGPLGFALGGQGSGRIAEAAGSTTIWVSWAGTGRYYIETRMETEDFAT